MSFSGYMCDDRQVPRPATGKTPIRNLRVGDEWDELGEAAGDQGRTAVIKQLIRWYLRYPGARLPERPSPEAAEIFREGSAE
jgi:hypothetical protein